MAKTRLLAGISVTFCFCFFLVGCASHSPNYSFSTEHCRKPLERPSDITCNDAATSLIPDDPKTLHSSSYLPYLYCLSSNRSLEDCMQYAKTYHHVSRPAGAQPDFPVFSNDTVKGFIQFFVNDKRDFTTNALIRSGLYLPRMRQIFREHGLPEDLVYLSFIESGFNPYAYSPAGACGQWQFMKATGERYGLRINSWVDERRDLEKSTRAAAKYLKDLYAMFNDWNLAVASYNAGEQKVLNATKLYQTNDFWKLREQCYLKQETCDFVPKLMAAISIAKNPEGYGLGTIKYAKPAALTTVNILNSTDLAFIAKLAGISVAELKQYNPELRKGCTPVQKGGYAVKIPESNKTIFAQSFEQYKANPVVTAQATVHKHRVKAGETLYEIARRYKTNVAHIQKVNKIRNPKLIHPGSEIIIPVSTLASSS